MKKSFDMQKFFRIAIVVVIMLLFLFVVAYATVFTLKGRISVHVDGDKYKIDNLTCYDGDEKQFLMNFSTSNNTKFMNLGLEYGSFEYHFNVKDGDLNVPVIVSIFKYNWHDSYNFDVKINIYKSGEYWNADVRYRYILKIL